MYKRAIFKKWHLDMIEFSQILNYKCIKSVLNILSIVNILFTINNLPITRLKDIILYIVHWYSSHVTLKCPVVTKTLYHSFLHKILRLLCNCWLNIRYQSLPLPHRKTIWCQHQRILLTSMIFILLSSSHNNQIIGKKNFSAKEFNQDTSAVFAFDVNNVLL